MLWSLESARTEDLGLLLRRTRNQALEYLVEFHTMDGEGLILSTIIRMAFSLAIKNGHMGGQFFQALVSRELYVVRRRTRNPAQRPVSSCWLEELPSTLLTWLPSLPHDESPLLGRTLTPCHSFPRFPTPLPRPTPAVWSDTSLWSSCRPEPCVGHLFHSICPWFPHQTVSGPGSD